MSILTKIFIILVFLVAVVKLGVDATLYPMRIDFKDKWHKEMNEHAQTIKIMTSEIESWKVEVENWKSQYRVEQDKNIKLNEELAGKNELIEVRDRTINEMNERYQVLEQELARMNTLLSVTSAQLEEMQKKVEEYKQNLDLALSKQQAAQQDLIYAKRDAEEFSKNLAELEKKHGELAREAHKMKETLAYAVTRGFKIPLPGELSPPLEGKVLSVSPDLGLIVISLGVKDGIKIGEKFTVYRGSKFIATAIVDKVDNNMSVLRIENKQEDPKENDNVSNVIGR